MYCVHTSVLSIEVAGHIGFSRGLSRRRGELGGNGGGVGVKVQGVAFRALEFYSMVVLAKAGLCRASVHD